MSNVELCRDTYRQMYRAMITKDSEALNAVLDDSFVLVHMTGMRQYKNAFIQAVVKGTLYYYSCEDDSVEATVNGDTATVIGKSRVAAAVFGGGRHTWRLEQDLWLAKKDDRWPSSPKHRSTAKSSTWSTARACPPARLRLRSY